MDGRITTHLGARAKPAERRNDGQQARCYEQRESTMIAENGHHSSVPTSMARVAQFAQVSSSCRMRLTFIMRSFLSSTTRLILVVAGLLGASRDGSSPAPRHSTRTGAGTDAATTRLQGLHGAAGFAHRGAHRTRE